MNKEAKKTGERNLRAVRKFFRDHLCATQVECSEAVGLSVMAVGRYVHKIRAEWRVEGNHGEEKERPGTSRSA